MKKHMKASDGKYHIHGKKYEVLEGSRARVWNGTAYKTSGGLKRDDLVYNKHGRVVSKKLHIRAKKEKRLEKHGYFTRKGHFGAIKSHKHHRHHKKHKSKKHKK